MKDKKLPAQFPCKSSQLPLNVGNRDMRRLSLLIIFLVVNLDVDRTSAELFSSIEELESLSRNEEIVINEIAWLTESLEETIVKLKKHVKVIEKEQEVMKKNSLDYVTNPLNAFLLVKRLSFDITQIMNHIVGVTEQFKRNTEEARLSHQEFEGVVEGLVRLQLVYDLKPADLAKGIIQGQKYREDLSAKDLSALGDELMNSHRYSMSLSYLNLAYEKNRETQELSPLAILGGIYRNFNETGNKIELINTIDKILELAPDLTPDREYLEEVKTMLEIEVLFEDEEVEDESVEDLYEKNGQYSKFKELKLISDVCSGKVQQSSKVVSELHCRLISTNAFTIIAPFKMEEMNLEPFIAMFYDVISDSEIQAFKSMSKPSLIRAETLNKDASTKVRLDIDSLNFLLFNLWFFKPTVRQPSRCKAQLARRFKP